MSVPLWLRSLTVRPNRTAQRTLCRSRFQPRVETLEDRTTPSATLLGTGPGAPASEMVSLNGSLYFYGDIDSAHVGLWKTDGTAAGTSFVASVEPTFLTAFDGALYFGNPNQGYTVWRSDGTQTGTRSMTDGTGNAVRLAPNASGGSPDSGFSDIAGTLYFDGIGADHTDRRWQVDGNQLVAGPTWGTVTAQFTPSSTSFAPSYNNFDRAGSMYFRGVVTDPNTNLPSRGSLFRYDATPTTPVLLHDASNDSVLTFPGTPPEYTAGGFLPMLSVNGRVVFVSRVVAPAGYGQGLWQTDGTPQGTSQLTNHPVGSGTFETGPTAIFPDSLSGPLAAMTSNTVFFPAATTDWSDVELWATDGTAAGTRLVKDINPGIIIDAYQGTGSNPLDLVAVGNTVYFTADDGVHGRELWKSDGTAAGTMMVADIVPGSGASDPADLTAVRGTLYFTADDGIHGRELWTTDGTAAGTTLVQDLNPGASGSNPRWLAAVGGRLVFSEISVSGLVGFWGLDTGLPNQAPVAIASIIGTPIEGPIQFNGSDSADPDGDPLTYSWMFSDGATSTARDPRHAFPDDGPATATLTVTDPYGLQSMATLNFAVANAAPTAAVTAASGTGGNQVSISLSADDPSQVDRTAGFTYRVDWGDGVVESIPATPGNGAGVTRGHSYLAAGVYQVRVSATDQDGAVGPTATSVNIVAGSPGADTIALTGLADGSGFDVTLNGQAAGSVQYTQVNFPNPAFNATIPFLVLGGTGDDTITLTNWESVVTGRPRLEIDGQDGSDTYSVTFTYNSDSLDWSAAASVSVADSGGTGDSDRLTVTGTAGDDLLYKTAGDFYARLNGSINYHVLYSGVESWTLDGGAGNDYIHDPGSANGTIRGGAGDDTIVVASTTGPVSVDGGDGSDSVIVQFGNLQGPVTVADTGQHGADTVQVVAAGTDPLVVSGSQVMQDGQTVTVSSSSTALSVSVPAGSAPPEVINGAVLFQRDLLIGGTAGDDSITVNAGGPDGSLSVVVNAVPMGRFQPTGRIVAYGYAGNDDIQVAGSVTAPAWLYGDDGNDRLKGGAGSNVLIGGEGDDLIVGGGSRDMLIGGNGADRIVGNAADDILIAGAVTFDTDPQALSALLDEWNSSHDYATRIANIEGVGTGDRLNGGYFLQDDVTVFNDGSQDVLTGSSGQDWFWANTSGSGVLDKITDLSASEFANDLDFILGS